MHRFAGRTSRLRAHLAVALVALSAMCGFGVAVGIAAPAFPTHVCGYFFRSGQDFIVYSGGGISCKKATKLIRGFVLGKAQQHGTSDADSYWTIKGEPGFRCTQSMGEGRCVKSNKIAAYVIKGIG